MKQSRKIALALSLTLGIGLSIFMLPPTTEQTTPTRELHSTTAQPTAPATLPQPLESRADTTGKSPALLDEFFPAQDPAWAWASIDMASVKEALPDNLYWEMGEPTDHTPTLEQRQEQRDFWKMQYGKVLSGTAREDEVHAYYDYQQQVSSDYLAFADYLLLQHSDQLPTRDVQLLTLVQGMHNTRLQTIPRKRGEAITRSKDHNSRREAWLADKDGYETALRKSLQAAPGD